LVFAQGGLSGMAEPECVPSSSYAQGGSSSRRAVISSSRPAGSTEVMDSSRSLSSKVGPISLRSSGVQRSSPVASAEPKRTVTSRHQSSNMRNYEAALKGVESLSVEVEQRQ
jgi:casein kinase 1